MTAGFQESTASPSERIVEAACAFHPVLANEHVYDVDGVGSERRDQKRILASMEA